MSGLINLYHQREKYNRLTFLLISLALVFGVIGLFKSFQFLLLISFLCIGLSLITEAIYFLLSLRQMDSMKQFIRAILIVAITLFFLFKLMKG